MNNYPHLEKLANAGETLAKVKKTKQKEIGQPVDHKVPLDQVVGGGQPLPTIISEATKKIKERSGQPAQPGAPATPPQPQSKEVTAMHEAGHKENKCKCGGVCATCRAAAGSKDNMRVVGPAPKVKTVPHEATGDQAWKDMEDKIAAAYPAYPALAKEAVNLAGAGKAISKAWKGLSGLAGYGDEVADVATGVNKLPSAGPKQNITLYGDAASEAAAAPLKRRRMPSEIPAATPAAGPKQSITLHGDEAAAAAPRGSELSTGVNVASPPPPRPRKVLTTEQKIQRMINQRPLNPREQAARAAQAQQEASRMPRWKNLKGLMDEPPIDPADAFPKSSAYPALSKQAEIDWDSVIEKAKSLGLLGLGGAGVGTVANLFRGKDLGRGAITGGLTGLGYGAGKEVYDALQPNESWSSYLNPLNLGGRIGGALVDPLLRGGAGVGGGALGYQLAQGIQGEEEEDEKEKQLLALSKMSSAYPALTKQAAGLGTIAKDVGLSTIAGSGIGALLNLIRGKDVLPGAVTGGLTLGGLNLGATAGDSIGGIPGGAAGGIGGGIAGYQLAQMLNDPEILNAIKDKGGDVADWFAGDEGEEEEKYAAYPALTKQAFGPIEQESAASDLAKGQQPQTSSYLGRPIEQESAASDLAKGQQPAVSKNMRGGKYNVLQQQQKELLQQKQPLQPSPLMKQNMAMYPALTKQAFEMPEGISDAWSGIKDYLGKNPKALNAILGGTLGAGIGGFAGGGKGALGGLIAGAGGGYFADDVSKYVGDYLGGSKPNNTGGGTLSSLFNYAKNTWPPYLAYRTLTQ